MNRALCLLIGVFYFCFCYGQDILIMKNGDELLAKVLEVTPTEIKYKRFDNLEGPVYTTIKSSLFMIKYENGTKEVIETSVETVQNTNQPKSMVYFLRKSGYAGSMTGYEVFIDEKSICKLNNNKFIIREINSGVHTFSVQFFGSRSKAKAEKLEIKMEPDKTYYVQVTQGGKVMAGDTWCIQLNEQEGRALLSKLKKDDDCN